MRRRLVYLLAFATACASSGGRPATDRSRTSSDVITLEEIQSAHWQNAYELVQTLRPRWLRNHGPDSILGETADVQVHVDDNRLGGTSTLRNIATADIASIQFVDPVSAAARWGGDHANGAIIITTGARD